MLQGYREITWPDLRFPPINLWVMASLANSEASASSEEPATSSVESDTRIHRRQRPGLTRTNALHKHLHRRLESILAVRGGKR